MTIKLNEFDRKLLSSIKPSDTWNKLKNIYTINGEVKRLKIGNNKIGIKCAQHLRKLSNKSDVTLNEIKDGCKDLIPKKHKHGLKKTSGKADVLKEHTKIDIGQDKPPPPKVKKPPKPRQPSATQQLVNLLSQQQLIAKKQTVQRQIQEVDKILTDRNKNVELPNQTPQISQLQLTRQSLGQQRQVGGLGIYAPLPRRPPRPSMPSITQNINGNVVGTTKTDEEILNQLRQNNQEKLQQIESIQQPAFRSLTNKLTDKDKNNRQNQLLDALTRMGQNQRTERNQKIFEDLTKKVESKQIDQNLDFLNELKAEISQQRFIADTQKRQEDSLNEAMNIMRERERQKKSDALGSLGLERTTSASLLERMERDSLKQSLENEELQRTLSATIESQVLDVGRAERKLKEQQESEAIFNKQKKLANEIKNDFMGFGDDEDKPLSQEELDKLKNIAQEEPSMEEKPRKVEKEGITIQPKNPLLKKVKKKSKKVVKKISGSSMEEKPSAEVAMEEKPSAEPIFFKKMNPLAEDTKSVTILKRYINEYNKEWVKGGMDVLDSREQDMLMKRGSIALMAIQEKMEGRYIDALDEKRVVKFSRDYDDAAVMENSLYNNQRNINYVNKKRMGQYEDEFIKLAQEQRIKQEE